MLVIRHLRLRVETSEHLFGFDVSFVEGLNVLRADNSKGKSTCLQSIIYALGLEGMLSPKRSVPLAHAMTDVISDGKKTYPVSCSYVEMEIANGRGGFMTIKRYVKSSSKDTKLIEVIDGPALTQEGGNFRRKDYFVRRPGSFARDAGFHHALAIFLGMDLPKVTRVDGSESPLYMECLFPFYFVEQKHGWSGIQARMPTYLGIRDLGSRSAEYVLSLDKYSSILKKQRLETSANLIKADWKEARTVLLSSASSSKVEIAGVPNNPVEDASEITIEGSVYKDGSWVSIDAEIQRVADFISRKKGQGVVSVDRDDERLEAELASLEEHLLMVNIETGSAIEHQADMQKREQSLELRVESLREDLQKHQDVKILRTLGSGLTPLLEGNPHCPTCHQSINDAFELTAHPMSIEDSISYIKEELQTFQAMLDDARNVLSSIERKISSLRREAKGIRHQIRSVKEALTSPSSFPSAIQLVEIYKAEDRRKELSEIRDLIIVAQEDFKLRANRWKENKDLRRDASNAEQSISDARVLQYVQKKMREQLSSYHFTSLNPNSIDISMETYRPTHEGFDFGFDLSASDMIRLIWSYLISILDAGIEFDTNHLRLLIFDEPRQQETQKISFRALLVRAAKLRSKGYQVIFATSEEPDSLTDLLHGLPVNLISHPRRESLLQRIS